MAMLMLPSPSEYLTWLGVFGGGTTTVFGWCITPLRYGMQPTLFAHHLLMSKGVTK
jgi:hypothetical protein